MAHDTENPKRIHLLGSGRHEEAYAAAALTPGHLLATDADGEVLKHATAGGVSEKLFALEDALQGRPISTAYAAAELVSMVLASPGDVVYAWLSEGETVTPASLLTSNGDGTLKVAGGSDAVLAKSMETLDKSDSGSEGDGRLKVRIV